MTHGIVIRGTRVGDVIVEAKRWGDDWCILARRPDDPPGVMTEDEKCLSVARIRCNDFEAGVEFEKQCAVWRAQVVR